MDLIPGQDVRFYSNNERHTAVWFDGKETHQFTVWNNDTKVVYETKVYLGKTRYNKNWGDAIYEETHVPRVIRKAVANTIRQQLGMPLLGEDERNNIVTHEILGDVLVPTDEELVEESEDMIEENKEIPVSPYEEPQSKNKGGWPKGRPRGNKAVTEVYATPPPQPQRVILDNNSSVNIECTIEPDAIARRVTILVNVSRVTEVVFEVK